MELIENFQETFDLENDYDEIYKVVNKGRVKYAKEYNDNGYEEVIKSVKRDFIDTL